MITSVPATGRRSARSRARVTSERCQPHIRKCEGRFSYCHRRRETGHAWEWCAIRGILCSPTRVFKGECRLRAAQVDQDMSLLTQSRLRGGLMAGASLAAVTIGLAAMDARVHKQVNQFMRGEGMSPEVASIVGRAQHLGWSALDSVRDFGLDNAPIAIFAIAAGILVMFMFRT
jgi:hypothetical protein